MTKEITSNRFFTAIEEAQWDVLMACAAIGLTLFGLVMVYSASGYNAATQLEGSFSVVLRQVGWAVIGIVVMLILMRIDYQRYASPTLILLGLASSVALLITVLFFRESNGAKRWIRWGQLSAQPSELAKIVLVMFLAYFLTRRNEEEREQDFRVTFLPAGLVTGALILLILKEPDLGTGLMLGLIFAVMMLAGRVPIWHLLSLIPPVLLVGYVYILGEKFRMDRLIAFWNPEATREVRQGAGYQILQSLYAVGSGGVSGVGLGGSKQKLGFLPEAKTDFIFAVVGEELGFVGSALVVLVFGLLMWRCLKASFRAPDQFGQLLGIGLTTMLIAQAFFNISVVLSLVPTKGITLPFVSAGGSSLVFALAAVGILLNISEQARAEE